MSVLIYFTHIYLGYPHFIQLYKSFPFYLISTLVIVLLLWPYTGIVFAFVFRHFSFVGDKLRILAFSLLSLFGFLEMTYFPMSFHWLSHILNFLFMVLIFWNFGITFISRSLLLHSPFTLGKSLVLLKSLFPLSLTFLFLPSK